MNPVDGGQATLVAIYPGLKNEAYGIACDIGSNHHSPCTWSSLFVRPHVGLVWHIKSTDPIRRRSDEAASPT